MTRTLVAPPPADIRGLDETSYTAHAAPTDASVCGSFPTTFTTIGARTPEPDASDCRPIGPDRQLERFTLAGHRFIMVSFEGPDAYSHAGGLAIRVTTLADALASAGALVDLYFVGDPDLPPVEMRGGVTLHRWCQWISAGARDGVYDGEERKIEDLCLSLPRHLADVVVADRAAGVRTVVLAEDWHTAWPLIAVHDELVRRGLREGVRLAWTANNRYGFERIDFARLSSAATLLTISRAMKHLMWGSGVNPVVVPNGIPDELLTPVSTLGRDALRTAFGHTRVLCKVGRWDPDKRWMMALDALSLLARRGERAVLLARGWNGTPAASAHYRELRARSAELGLRWSACAYPERDTRSFAAAVCAAAPAQGGVVELTSPLVGTRLQDMYAASDAVLANSGFEPFGLVGLEAMAARSIVITGATGEDYLIPFHNGFALETDDPAEILRALDWLGGRHGKGDAMRQAAFDTARRYCWPAVVDRLVLALGLVDPGGRRSGEDVHATAAATFQRALGVPVGRRAD